MVLFQDTCQEGRVGLPGSAAWRGRRPPRHELGRRHVDTIGGAEAVVGPGEQRLGAGIRRPFDAGRQQRQRRGGPGTVRMRPMYRL